MCVWNCIDKIMSSHKFQFVEIVQDVMIITKNRIKKGYVSLVQSTEVQPLSDCKGRALRKVQEKDSARVKGEAP
jgi:hypothetical protein